MKKFAIAAVAVLALTSCGGASSTNSTSAPTTVPASASDEMKTETFTLTVGEVGDFEIESHITEEVLSIIRISE